MELPPILPDIEEELKSYLVCLEKLPIHQYERNQEFWPREPDPKELFDCDNSPLSTTLKVQRDPNTGEILEFIEVPLQAAGATPKNSMSFNRAPAPPSEAARGNASYFPFWPGSFPEIKAPPKVEIEKELLTIPPGFQRGLKFKSDNVTVINDETEEELEERPVLDETNVVNLIDLINQEQDILNIWNKSETKQDEQVSETITPVSVEDEEDVIPKEAPILHISSASDPNPGLMKGTEWAILLDASKPVTNFEEKIPKMAYNFKFELDTFQKLAILQLEQHNHIFVAAHTSAGKTVVAEYAIALSQEHKTRTIYTSPIKALSNQKYRDFKKVFDDVGLITGDFQTNQTASCLIMTTEILRSMLYCGSDITRDLEFVIFDEVHYINDKERGHVWEQVLILLPRHVCVVLLSATVPNTIEFADWLGRTHERKVYVVTTPKRPVPLQHFLYTGKGGGSRDNRFLILNSNVWITEGYFKAKDSLKADQAKFANKRILNPQDEKRIWIGLIDHLKRKDLLPVIAFTFSRKKCDINAENLLSLDLTTQKEKVQIISFFNKCISSLKEPDRNIPQILKMKEILNKGIGVHHSGILPIIKEIVEMLFQRGLIKLLFATETFAMGVNMPARTVIFDSVCKHDGKELRDLEPAEYIQMAGRAGRRGLDKEGTVIILCKLSVPPEDSLKKMMMGKPSSLVSQFRLTYGMVLNLLRVESLSVEGMMCRSFREADHQKRLVDLQKDLKQVEEELEDLSRQQLSSYLQPLVQFYEAASKFLRARNEILPLVYNSSKVQKALVPGRIVLITQKGHINKLAIILQQNKSKCFQYQVLVLTDSNKTEIEGEELWFQMLSLAEDQVFVPIGSAGHEVLTINCLDIFEISSKILKINAEFIIKDWEKRQMERFKDDPPGQSCIQAIQELEKLTRGFSDNSIFLEYLHLINDLKINEQDFYHSLKELYDYKDRILDHILGTQIPNFRQQFSVVFKRKFLEDKKENLEFQLSNASLSLYPDYENRIKLLKELKYVDDQNRVQLKGRVACEMGMNELLITELVLEGILTKLKPEEVAALLSALVFRVKLRDDIQEELDELSEDLKKGIREITDVHKKIANLEISLQIHTDEFQEDLNFGLVNVVHKWASSKPFAEIMELTEIQEGIIVRCIQQLNETICDVRDAARIIGDPELQSKMEDASAAIKRDIVFAASLYTNKETL